MGKSIILCFIVSMILISCDKKTKTENEVSTKDSTAVEVTIDHHNAMNSLDYQGTYRGNLPCADCEAIETTLILSDDSFQKETIYKGKSKEVYKETGKYEWNAEGNTITLIAVEKPNQYFVGENIIYALDIEGNRIKGNLADTYQLYKKSDADGINQNKISLQETQWKLIKLSGKKIKHSNQGSVDEVIGISFHPKGRVSAYSGCNRLGGSFELNEDLNKLKFSKLFSTKMACEEMNLESELLDVLTVVDHYTLDGTTLKLHRGIQTNVAEFTIVK